MSEFSDLIIPSLPSPISGNGLFPINVVVPNADSSFNPTPSNPSTSYSYPLMDPAKLIGTGSQPYMPVGLPAYITTLYNNVYNINTNLSDDLSQAAVDDRTYPTSFAVQKYVQSQIAGSQIINGGSTPLSNTYIVTTTLNNTLVTSSGPGTGFKYANSIVALFWMDETADAPRNGASKTVMFGDSGFLTDSTGVATGRLAFLYAGDSSFFINMGVKYKYYQFVYTGDYVNCIQAYNPGSTTTSAGWDWLVTASMGVFSDTVVLSDGADMNILPDGAKVQVPANRTFGGL